MANTARLRIPRQGTVWNTATCGASFHQSALRIPVGIAGRCRPLFYHINHMNTRGEHTEEGQDCCAITYRSCHHVHLVIMKVLHLYFKITKYLKEHNTLHLLPDS